MDTENHTPPTETFVPKKRTSENAAQRILKTISLHKGLVLVLLGCFCLSISSVIIKTLDGRIPSMQVVFWRQMSIFLFSSPLLVFNNIPLKMSSREMRMILVYIVLIAFSFTMSFYALEQIPAADMSAIYASCPIFTGIIAWMLLREKFTVLDAIMFAVALLGVTLIARPSFLFGATHQGAGHSGNTLIGAMAALTSAIVSALCTVMIRHMGRTIHPFYQAWWTGLGGWILVGLVTTCLGTWQLPRCGHERLALILSGFASFMYGVLVAFALRIEKAVYVSLFRTNTVILTFILEFLVFRIAPHWLSVLGAVLIMASSLCITINRFKAAGKEET